MASISSFFVISEALDADLLGLVGELVLGSVFQCRALVIERSLGLRVRNPRRFLLGHAFIAEGFVQMGFLISGPCLFSGTMQFLSRVTNGPRGVPEFHEFRGSTT